MVVDFSNVLLTLLQFILAALGALATYGLPKVFNWLNLQNDDKLRELVEQAMHNGLAYAGQLVRDKVVKADFTKIDIRNAVVANAANYVIAHVPDALAHFKITPELLEEKLHARMSVLTQP